MTIRSVIIALACVLLLGSPASAADLEIARAAGLYVGTDGKNSITIKVSEALWGEPMTLEKVYQDQETDTITTFTPWAEKQEVTVRDLDRSFAYRLTSPRLDRPVTFRLGVSSTTSTAVDVDTTPAPPQGVPIVQTVGPGESNSDWFLNPYSFPEVGQTVTVDDANSINTVVFHFAPSVTTLLTAEGVELMKNPSQIDWSDPKTQGIEIYNDDPSYSFTARATVRLYSGVKDANARSLDTSTLRRVTSTMRKVTISHNGYLAFRIPPTTLAPGSYLVTLKLDDAPKDVLSVFLVGANYGGKQNPTDIYPAGAAYQVDDPRNGKNRFIRATTKRQPVSSVGKDKFDPGDLSVILMDTA